MPPRVSVCIPVFEEPSLAVRALQSAIDQSMAGVEIVITDDSRTEDVEVALAQYRHFERVTYRRNPTRLGAAANWNAAIRLATGTYVKMLHHDDWFRDRESLQRYVDLLDDNPRADFAFSAVAVHHAQSGHITLHRPSDVDLARLCGTPRRLGPTNLVGPPSATIFRRTANPWFDVRLSWLVDIDFYLTILHSNPRFAYCAEPLVNVAAGLPRQLTRSCEENADVEVFESVCLYQKLRREGRAIPADRVWLDGVLQRFEPLPLARAYRSRAGERLSVEARWRLARRRWAFAATRFRRSAARVVRRGWRR